jgi:hypothetical protein
MKKISNIRGMWIIFYAISFCASLYLTSRHSYLWSGDADAANSPIVWRAFLERGWDAFNQWQPTFDNWYFTVYPLNFAIFFLLGDDGLQPLVISSALFIFIISVCVSETVRKYCGNKYGLLAIIAITFISPDLYRNGYFSHPFSHNSTNAYGFVILVLYITSLRSNSVVISLVISTLSLLASVSDPWLLASFFLPILITEVIALACGRKNKFNIAVYALFFLIAASNIVQKVLGLPIHSFMLADLPTMFENLKLAAIITSKILPISTISYGPFEYFVFIVWVIVVAYAALMCILEGGVVRYISIFALLSIMGIYSSSIIGDQTPHQRFYLNIVPMVIIICCLASSFKNRLIMAPVILSLATCLYSYASANVEYKLGKNPVEGYISFLERNDLHYGYGSFWGMNMGVNWLSGGNIHITPVYFHKKTGIVNFKDARVQTMKFWHTPSFIEGKPKRQFISLKEGKTGDQCPDLDLCRNGVESKLGKPDEILTYQGMLFLVYNNRINTGL